MATTKTTDTEEVLKALAFAGITFTMTLTAPEEVTLDKAGDRSGGLPSLQFDKLFDMYLPHALADEKPGTFVPTSLFQARSDHHFEVVIKQPSKKRVLTASDVKGKLRDEFKKWQKAPKEGSEEAKVRASVYLGFATRTGKEGIKGIVEPGVTMWLLKAKAE